MQHTQQNEVTYPLPQAQGLKVFAKIISYIFHPLFIPVYISAYLIYSFPFAFAVFDEKHKFLELVSIFLNTAFFPAFTVFLLRSLGFAESIYLRTQKERIIPYVASIIFFFWAFRVSNNTVGTPDVIIFFLLGLFLSTSCALMANSFFKISMHAIGVSGAATFMMLLGIVSGEPIGTLIAVTTFIAGLVCTARLIVSDHHPMEIYWGLFVGAICQVVACYIIVG